MAYNGKYMHGMGWTLVVTGFLSITLGITADALFGSMDGYYKLHYIIHHISPPIWNGICVVITGILAINSGKKPTSKGLMLAVMVLGIITIVTALCCFSLAIVGSIDAYYDACYYYSGDCTSLVLHVVNALLTLPEIVMAFAAAIMPCWGLASTNNPNGLPVFGYNQLQDQEGPGMAPWHYGTMDPPPYMPQSTIGAAPAQPPAAGQPPSGPPSETIPKSPT